MIENYKDFKLFLEKLNNRPRILLHACCAPCSSYTLLFLMKYFDVTIFYSNDNIYPKEEFDRRLDEITNFIKNFDGIDLIYDEYDNNNYDKAVKGLEDLGEKSARCYKCYEMRLTRCAIKAKELNYDYFTTTLSISPHKIDKWINEIGYRLEEEYGVKYLYSNFKKEEGYKKSCELSKKYNLYRQDYCGCKYSKEVALKK